MGCVCTRSQSGGPQPTGEEGVQMLPENKKFYKLLSMNHSEVKLGYTGEYLDRKRNGIGAMKYPNGDVYIGYWKDGKKHGNGKIVYHDGAEYEGSFLKGKRHGKGRYTNTDGSSYVGVYIESNMNGQGMYTWPDGTSYDGAWKDNKRHGYGIAWGSDGSCYNGRWEDDVMISIGIPCVDCCVDIGSSVVDNSSLIFAQECSQDISCMNTYETVSICLSEMTRCYSDFSAEMCTSCVQCISVDNAEAMWSQITNFYNKCANNCAGCYADSQMNYLQELLEKDLDEIFDEGVKLLTCLMKQGNKVNGEHLSELFVLYKQAQLGPASPSFKLDPLIIEENTRRLLEKQYIAWKALGTMNCRTAKILFISKMKNLNPCYDFNGSVKAVFLHVNRTEAELQAMKC